MSDINDMDDMDEADEANKANDVSETNEVDSMDFSQKLKQAREALEISQEELGKRVGVSRRSINSYENEGVVPRDRILRALALAMGVSMTYLVDDEISDSDHGKTREAQIEAARTRFGARAAKEAERLLSQNAAFFAGGEMPQEDKDAFFEAVMSAYLACKETARFKYGPRAAQSAP